MKITVSSDDGKIRKFVARPEQVQACWNEAFKAMQELGTQAMSKIEVITITPLDEKTVQVRLVISNEDQRRDSHFTGHTSVPGSITSDIITTFWSLIRDITICLENSLQAWNVRDFSKNPCMKCGTPMMKNGDGEGFFCLACSSMVVAKSDWVLEPPSVARPVFGKPTDSPPIAGQLMFAEDLRCPKCGASRTITPTGPSCENCGLVIIEAKT